MEHIQKPRYRNQEDFWIPYICGADFKYENNGTFEEYGTSLGWSKDFGEAKDPALVAEAAIILQKWLFFGLLSEFFRSANVEIEITDFVRADERGSFLSTRNLSRLLTAWTAAIKHLDPPSRKRAAGRVEDCLKVAQARTNYLGNQQEVFFSQILLGVLMLGATLGYYRREVFKPGGICPVPGWKGQSNYRGWSKSKYLIQRMMANGWCPSELAQLYSTSLSVMGIFFAATLERPQRNTTHESCTEAICHFFQVEEDTYQTRHVQEDCHCSHRGPDPDEICAVLHRGGIPLVRLSKSDAAAGLQLEILEQRQNLSYIAISHVWADGLGHVTQNSLPVCQLERLFMQLRPLGEKSREVTFWIDTLCVPARPHAANCSKTFDEFTCRMIAISRLKEAYQEANKVLVLDWEVERSNTSYAEESLMRIMISAWMRRLWTFQEAKLARTLYFLFKDKVVKAEDFLYSLSMGEQESLWAEVAESFLGLRGIFNQAGDSHRIAAMWNSYQGRATSNFGDEALSLSIMLGLDTRTILNTDDKQRMLKLFSMIDVYPKQILFMPGPRLEAPGYAWAPTSFLSRHQWANGSALEENQLHHADAHTMDLQCPLAYRADQGLILRSPGFILDPPQLPLFPYFAIHDVHQKFLGAAIYMLDRHAPDWTMLKIDQFQKLGVVLESPVKEGGAVLAVLVSNCSIERGIVFCDFICRLWFGGILEGQPVPSLMHKKVDVKSGAIMTEIAVGNEFDENQMWCVG